MQNYPDKEIVDQALNTLFSLPEFERSKRLRDFLGYVVSETIAGRGSRIRAKTIAQDVYERDTTGTEDSSNIVRVDARRLRRVLNDHYANAGADSELQIFLRSGSYVPEFETRAVKSTRLEQHLFRRQARRYALPLVAACLIAFCCLAVWAWFFQTPQDGETLPGQATAERLALFDHSGAALQAEHLCTQGKGLLFPIVEKGQQEAANALFRRAAELAPEYSCGFAGAGHSLATQALLVKDTQASAQLLTEAQIMASRAQALAPKDGWAISAVAWTVFAKGSYQEAVELSKLSEQLSPQDGNVLDFHGVISVLTGNYAEARRATDPARERDTSGLSHANRNIYGVASFHAGDYKAAIDAWNEAIRLGEPVSALTLTYLTAAHQADGQTDLAAQYAQDLKSAWPRFPVDTALARLYADKAVADGIVSLLFEAGWTSPS